MGTIAASELVINKNGAVYHLNLKPGELASKIICVGDPDRVAQVSQHFDTLEFTRQKREFVTATGSYKGQRLSVISTGIGTDNMDIVMTEIDALFNVDFKTRQITPALTSVQFLRLGTCGGLQAGIPVGTLINSRYAIGGDGLLPYYEIDSPAAFSTAFQAFSQEIDKFPIPFYTASGDAGLAEWLAVHYPTIVSGITFTAAGFFGPQGRGIGRLPIRFPHLPEQLADFSFEGFPVANMEMETAALLGMGTALGHRAGSLCVILANRRSQTFSEDPASLVASLIQTGLDIFHAWE